MSQLTQSQEKNPENPKKYRCGPSKFEDLVEIEEGEGQGAFSHRILELTV